MSRARRVAVTGAVLSGLLAATNAAAQDHPVMSAVWPADLVGPAQESWVTDRSTGAAKTYFRLWAASVTASLPKIPIDARFAYPATASIVKATIDSQGRPKALALVRSSGIEAFDAFALQDLRSVGSFAPPPGEVLQGRETIDVVAQFGAMYYRLSDDRKQLIGVPRVVVDAPARPYDAAAWKQFEQTLAARVREVVEREPSKPRTVTDLTLVFEYGDGVISGVKILRATGDPEFGDRVLARARGVAAQLKMPDRSSLSGMALQFHFDPAPSAAAAQASSAT